MKSGREEQSVYFYLKAIALDNTNTSAHFNYGIALYCMDYYKDAVDQLSIAVALEPNSSDIQYTFARYSATVGASYEAFKHGFKAIVLQPLDLKGYDALMDVFLLTCLNLVIGARSNKKM